MNVATINLNHVSREVALTIKVSGARELALRLRFAAALMALAGHIAGPRAEVTVEFTGPDAD